MCPDNKCFIYFYLSRKIRISFTLLADLWFFYVKTSGGPSNQCGHIVNHTASSGLTLNSLVYTDHFVLGCIFLAHQCWLLRKLDKCCWCQHFLKKTIVIAYNNAVFLKIVFKKMCPLNAMACVKCQIVVIIMVLTLPSRNGLLRYIFFISFNSSTIVQLRLRHLLLTMIWDLSAVDGACFL